MSSGNPGYLVGKPILSHLEIISSTTQVIQPVELIEKTILRASSTGDCPSTDLFRIPIKFGINILSECKLR